MRRRRVPVQICLRRWKVKILEKYEEWVNEDAPRVEKDLIFERNKTESVTLSEGLRLKVKKY